jgi:hypothetical protein
MKRSTIALFGVLLGLVLLSAFYFHHQHSEHLHQISGTNSFIAKEDHDRFLREGIHCQEVYQIQGYEGPETILR